MPSATYKYRGSHVDAWAKLRLKASLPDGLDTLAEVVEDVAVLGPFTDIDAATCWEETTDDSLDMSSYIELFGFFYTNALNTQAKATDAFDDHRLTIGQTVFHHILKFGYAPNKSTS